MEEEEEEETKEEQPVRNTEHLLSIRSQQVKDQAIQEMICEVCQTNSKLNLSRFILVKTDNKIITKSGDNLVFPTCACDFADPLNC